MHKKIAILVLLLSTVPITGCSDLLFFPSNNVYTEPQQHGYHYQNLYIEASDGILLNAWLMPRRSDERKGAIIYFHGNAQNISSHVVQVIWLLDEGYDVMLVDYRGYGASQGTVDLDSTIDDIKISIEYFLNLYPKKTKKYLLGQSLGGAMSGYVAATQPQLTRQFSAIMLDASFASYQRVTRNTLSNFWLTWFFQYPLSWTIPSRYDLIDVIDKISPTPLLISHGTLDKVVSFDHAEDLFAQAQRPKSFLWFDGPHISVFNDEKNRQAVLNFFDNGRLEGAM